MTCCYEAFHEDSAAFRAEAFHRHNTALKEDVGSHRQRNSRFQRVINASGSSQAASQADMYAQHIMELDADGLEEPRVQILRSVVVPELAYRWEVLNEENQSLFRNIWEFPMTSPSLFGAHYDAVAEYVLAKEALIGTIADSLASFKQLHTFAFVEPEIDGSKRYKKLFQEAGDAHAIAEIRKNPYAGGSKNDEHSEKVVYNGFVIGLDIVLRALQRAEIRPQNFTMPTPSLGFHSFTTSISENVIRQVLKDIRKLYLKQVSRRFLGSSVGVEIRPPAIGRTQTPPNHTRMQLTSENFPGLRDLVIRITAPANLDAQAYVTSEQVAQLETLTIRYHPDNGASALPLYREPDCLNHFGPHLKHLTIINAFRGNWNHFFREIAKLHLETLNIVMEEDVFQAIRRKVPSFLDVESGLVCVQEHFEKAANKCDIKPGWIFKMVRQVWKNQDDAIDRLLEDSDEAGGFDWEEDISDDEN